MNRRRAVTNAAGIAWVIAAAIVTLAPALHHGLLLGPYDILSQNGLTQVPGATVRNSVTGDQINEMIPWSTLAWTQVHQGHLPLWNPYSGLGMPLAFNWQSAVFSLPTLIGYAFPLHLAFTTQIITTLVIAGTGAYALGRVLGLGVIGCATLGTVYELSGSFVGWLGWPHASVMSWAGWLFALAILIVRGRHRVRYIVAFAVATAFAIFAGEPEIFAILAVSLALFVFSMLLVDKRLGRPRGVRRPLGDLSIAAVAGVALSAPLTMPGLQVLGKSGRNSGAMFAGTEVSRALPPHDLVHLFVQGYNGLPLAGNEVFGDAVYTDTAAYVGFIALALAVVGLVYCRQRAVTVGFAVVAAVTLAIVYVPPIQAVFDHIPIVQAVDWHRDLMMLGLCVAALAGVGVDALVRSTSTHAMRLLALALAGGLLILGVVWLAGGSGLSTLDARLRRDSLTWPLITTAAALIVVVTFTVLMFRRSPPRTRHLRALDSGRMIAVLLLLLETVFLVISGAQIWSSSAKEITPTAAVTSLVDEVGSSVVGFGRLTCALGPGNSSLGVVPESNILFGLHEFDIYDPVLPSGYVRSWADISRSPAGVPIFNSFCPAFTTAAQARRFGVAFVLEPEGAKGPSGATFDRRLGQEDLYRIPGSAAAVLVPAMSQGSLPPEDAPGSPIAVDHTSATSLRLTANDRTNEVLRLRLTDEPGWHATMDGHPLALEPFDDVMMQARLPAGRHVIELDYRPPLFTVGLVVGGAALLFLVLLALGIPGRLRKSQKKTNRPDMTCMPLM